MIKRILSIFGPDGSGKTTQVDRVSTYLKDRHDCVSKVWIKSPHTIALLIMTFLGRISPSSLYKAPSGAILAHRLAQGNRVNGLLWSTIEIGGAIPKLIVNVYLPILFKRTIIADRFIPDTIAHVAYITRDNHFMHSFLARTAISLVIRSSVFIFLDTDYTELKRRRKEMIEPREYVDFIREVYNDLSNTLGAARIDTTHVDAEETFKIIVECIENAEYA